MRPARWSTGWSFAKLFLVCVRPSEQTSKNSTLCTWWRRCSRRVVASLAIFCSQVKFDEKPIWLHVRLWQSNDSIFCTCMVACMSCASCVDEHSFKICLRSQNISLNFAMRWENLEHWLFSENDPELNVSTIYCASIQSWVGANTPCSFPTNGLHSRCE